MESEKENAQIKKAFDVFDIECEEQINAEELEDALRIAKMNPTTDNVMEIKQKLGNPEKISREQFEQIVKEINATDQRADLKEAFACFVPDGEKTITPQTLKEIVRPMIGKGMTEEELDAIIKDADKDGDGTIDIEEFVDFMMGE